MSVNPVPSIEESAIAVVKAVNVRRERHAADPTYAALSPADIAEQVTGITLPSHGGRDNWWLVGRVLDELVDAEFSVWYLPGSRRIGVSQRSGQHATRFGPV
jgi:hypothetical protein